MMQAEEIERLPRSVREHLERETKGYTSLGDGAIKMEHTITKGGFENREHRALVMMSNHWSVSIINYGYGSEAGLLEYAMLYNDHLDYTCRFTKGDVVGNLTLDELNAELVQLAKWCEENPE